jgi:hypothetical protein
MTPGHRQFAEAAVGENGLYRRMMRRIRSGGIA